MKCCGSQTTSIVPKAIVPKAIVPRPEGRVPNAAREAAVAFDTLVLREAFKPLAKALGFYGDMVVDAAVQQLARSVAAATLVPPSLESVP